MEEAFMPRIFQRICVFSAKALVVVSIVSVVLIYAFGPLAIRAAAPENSDNSLQQRIDRLEAGVQAEESIRAIKRLQYTYGHYSTSGLWLGK
jgi:hypothetical protein